MPPHPCGICAIGVRVFPDGRDPKTSVSLAAARRLARQSRRRRDRYLQRRQALLNALIRNGLMPADPAARAAIAALDPYALRADALARRLEPYELGRVVFHLNQRRGFRSNRKTDRDNEDEKGKVRRAADRLTAEIARSGQQTLGAWLAARHARHADVRARLHGAGAKAEYPFYPTREMVAAEFDAIWAAQAQWNPTLATATGDELRKILFFQRDLRDPPVGRCWLKPTEPRAPRALPSTQAFRIAQDLAHLEIRRVGEPDEPLTGKQRDLLDALLNAGRDRSFDQIRRQLGLVHPDTAPSGALHNDTAYADVEGAGPGEPNMAHRVPVASLAGWKAGDVDAAVPDPRLREYIRTALGIEGKPAQATALSQIPHAPGVLVRRVQVRERLDHTAAIADRRTGRPYKRVKLDANHRAEFWRLPATGGKPGKVVMVVVPVMQAAMDAEAKRLGRKLTDGRPHPAARLLMRLHKNDVVTFGMGEARRLLRVVKFSKGAATLAPLYEAGNLKARDADRNDAFKYINGSITRFREEAARKVQVDPTGRVRDPGPLDW